MPRRRQCCSVCSLCLRLHQLRRQRRRDYESSSASAPVVMSRISIVMALWRARLYSSVRSSISSSALDVALSMATMRAPCSAALDSSSARHI